MTWPGHAGLAYRVAHRSSLIETNWTDLSGDLAGADSPMTWSDTIPSDAGTRFYTLRVVCWP